MFVRVRTPFWYFQVISIFFITFDFCLKVTLIHINYFFEDISTGKKGSISTEFHLQHSQMKGM